MATLLTSPTDFGVEFAFNAHREAMQDAAVMMLAYITLQEELKLGDANRPMALHWWSLGWVTREARYPDRWALTDEGRRFIRAWHPPPVPSRAVAGATGDVASFAGDTTLRVRSPDLATHLWVGRRGGDSLRGPQP